MNPIFIIGCQRSGTTLLGSLLGSSPDVITIPESQFLPKLLQQSGQYHPWLMRQWRFRLWNFQPPVSTASGPTDYWQHLIIDYARYRKAKAPLFWCDHTPDHLDHVSFLLEQFPEAKFIHLIRDGRAAFASVQKLEWGPFIPEEGVLWWNQAIEKGLQLETSMPSKILRLHYETLLTEPEKSLIRVCQFLHLEYSSKMLQGGGFQPPLYTLSQHQKVISQPDPSRIDAWKSILSKRQIERLESGMHPYLDTLGYERVHTGSYQPRTRQEMISDHIRLLFNQCLKTPFRRIKRRLRSL